MSTSGCVQAGGGLGLRVGVAERAGFEPAIPQRGIPVFETGAFNRSATSPQRRLLLLPGGVGKVYCIIMRAFDGECRAAAFGIAGGGGCYRCFALVCIMRSNNAGLPLGGGAVARLQRG